MTRDITDILQTNLGPILRIHKCEISSFHLTLVVSRLYSSGEASCVRQENMFA